MTVTSFPKGSKYRHSRYFVGIWAPKVDPLGFGWGSLRKPESMSFEDAAALPLTFQTAWEGLVEQMNVSRKKESDHSSKYIIV